MKLNLKDRRILAELDLNARASFQEVAKKARLSKESVIYRVKLLEKKNIIQRYITLVNFSKLGYTGYAVFSRFQNVNEEIKKNIIKYLSAIPELYWIALVGGKFDFVFGIMARSVFEFNKVYYKILTEFGNYLVDNNIEIRTELRQHKRKYLIEEKPELFEPPFFGKEPEIEELDDLDENILSLLSNNARMTVISLAEALKRPSSTISLRIKQLEKKGIIQGYSAYIKAQNYGMQSYRLLLSLQNMDEKKRSVLFAYVNSNKNCILAIECVGGWNFEITLEVENQEQLQKEISNLRNQFKDVIKNVEFIIMFEDDLVYDPYPLKKCERRALLKYQDK
ncbi:Lrp/AsnC family transcriptional regulator [Candidatus Woesearchaeota archaeon]|nr:Lrp/AsnC family transcriptional regulator [Candidatus Woesearchaeota archaeon]